MKCHDLSCSASDFASPVFPPARLRAVISTGRSEQPARNSARGQRPPRVISTGAAKPRSGEIFPARRHGPSTAVERFLHSAVLRTAPVEMTGEERRGNVMIRHGRLQPDARHAFRRGLVRSCRPVPPYCRRAAPTNEQMFIYCSYCECQALLCAAPVPTVGGITRRPRVPAVTRTPALRRRALPAGKAGFSAGPLHREFPAPTSPSAPCGSFPASVARAAHRRDRARRCRSRASGRRSCVRGPDRWC